MKAKTHLSHNRVRALYCVRLMQILEIFSWFSESCKVLLTQEHVNILFAPRVTGSHADCGIYFFHFNDSITACSHVCEKSWTAVSV